MKPPMNADERRLDEITKRITGCAYAVSNTLGADFIEKVYERAVVIGLRANGLPIAQQRSMSVRYKGTVVGDYVADLLVSDEAIVGMKAARALDEAHAAQCMNHLKATGLRVALLLNFGKPRVELRRIVQGFEQTG
jgi:GxxExxY protein